VDEEKDDPLMHAAGCQVSLYDIIYTDIGGFRHLWPDVTNAVM
jgi:hypothetical protein